MVQTLVGLVLAAGAFGLIVVTLLKLIRVGPVIASIPTVVRDISGDDNPLPTEYRIHEIELQRLGFARIGQVELAWASHRARRPEIRMWKYASDDPAISGGIRAGTGLVVFWTAWPDETSLTTTYPPLRRPSWWRFQYQGTDDGVEAAYRLHRFRLAAINRRDAVDLRTMAGVIEGDELEIAGAAQQAREVHDAFALLGAAGILTGLAVLLLAPNQSAAPLAFGLIGVAVPVVISNFPWSRLLQGRPKPDRRPPIG